jgi:serine/threonine protein kinase
MAIEKLHSAQLIYRDLKPENILIDSDGFLKVSNFGMVKQLKKDEKAMTLCGTPEYMGKYYNIK